MAPNSSRSKPPPLVAPELPSGLSQPALRALTGAGITRLEQLTRFSEDEIRQLHGIGPNALDKLRRALAAGGLSYAAAPQAGKPATKARGKAAAKPEGAKRR